MVKKINLFHSYLYIENTKNIYLKNNKIYDSNDNFICGLLNLPSETKGIKIIIEKQLTKKKQSLKNIETFFEKNNIKIYVEYDFDYINYFKNDKIFYKLLKENYYKFLNEYLLIKDLICFNNNYNKQIVKSMNIEINDSNLVNIYNNNFCLKTNKLSDYKYVNKRSITITNYHCHSIFKLFTWNIKFFLREFE